METQNEKISQNEKKVIEKIFYEKVCDLEPEFIYFLKTCDIRMFLKMHGNTEAQSGSTTETFPSTSSKTGSAG